jgi:hypothetical protein
MRLEILTTPDNCEVIPCEADLCLEPQVSSEDVIYRASIAPGDLTAISSVAHFAAMNGQTRSHNFANPIFEYRSLKWSADNKIEDGFLR